MATPVTEVVKVNWKQVCPWLALFRSLGLSLHLRQICVGVIAAGLIGLVHWLILGRMVSRQFSGITLETWATWVWAPLVDLTWPLKRNQRFLFGPAVVDHVTTWVEALQILLSVIWAGIVGGLAGGILSRRAAFEFCREESLSLKSAVRFVLPRTIDYLSAPGLPLLAVLGMSVLLIFTGWLAAMIPGGQHLLSAVWGLCLLVGLLMSFLSVATLCGWPMMIAAVSINGGDGFDALSRGFGFVLDRWRYYAGCALLMTVYGTFLCLILFGLLAFGDDLTAHSVGLGLGINPLDKNLPAVLPADTFRVLISLLMSGLAYSFFWSNMTVIYLLLRKSVDNTDLDSLPALDDPNEPDDLQALLTPPLAAPPTLLPIIDPPQMS